MKILITSYAFAPSVGGIETVSRVMAETFTSRGHTVKILTQSTGECTQSFPYEVIRTPTASEIWKAVQWADIVWQNNTSLKYLWAATLQNKPTAVTLQCALYRHYPRKYWQERLKSLLLKRCRIFAISHYVTQGLNCEYTLLGNPFEAEFQAASKGINRDQDIVFLGRLVSDKGADLLLEALGQLAQEQIQPKTTIIGDGPELEPLKQQAKQLGLSTQIRFTGYLTGDALHKEIARHRIMVIPSRWKEPFGIVALEGIAAGCAVIASEGGGLPEAVGPCGLTFKNDDVAELKEKIQQLVQHPQLMQEMSAQAESHLSSFSIDAQADAYLDAFQTLVDQAKFKT